MRRKVNLVILNYNGLSLLERFLPSVVKAAESSSHDCRVTVLDNCSSDKSAGFVKREFPSVLWTETKSNKVLCAYNDFAAASDDDILVLLNNDIEVEVDFLDPLIQVFEDHPDAFFAATHGDCSIVRNHWGVLTADIEYPGYNQQLEMPGFAFSAGIGAFDRKKFVELEGYDELYLPGRYEDVDLCYRGWRMGWKGYYVPQSRKFHLGGASFNDRYKSGQIQALVFRNGLLFMVKNVTDIRLWAALLFLLLLRLAGALLRGKWFLFTGLYNALRRLPDAIRARRRARFAYTKSDRDVIQLVGRKINERGSIGLAKKIVNFLGENVLWRKPFFWSTFYTLRLFRPLQYLVLRELMDCSEVLDLGCGRHSMVPILPSKTHTVGVEFFGPHLEEAVIKGRHKKYIHDDITKVTFPKKSFDAVALLDVLEHLPKEEGLALLEKMEKWAKKKVVVFTPNGFLDQHEYDGNPYMAHQSGWSCEEFKKRGYDVYGVRGFKSLIKNGADHHDHENERPSLAHHLGNLAQVVTYHWPEQAFQLFCVKRLDE